MNFLLFTDVPDFGEPANLKNFQSVDYTEVESEEEESECSCEEPSAAACITSSYCTVKIGGDYAETAIC